MPEKTSLGCCEMFGYVFNPVCPILMQLSSRESEEVEMPIGTSPSTSLQATSTFSITTALSYLGRLLPEDGRMRRYVSDVHAEHQALDAISRLSDGPCKKASHRGYIPDPGAIGLL